MFLNKIGEGMEVDGITYTVGQRITANKNSDYDGATGIIIEISDEEDGVDIYCDLERPTDPEVIARIEKRFSYIYDEPRTLDEIPLDGVSLCPDEID